MENEHRRRLNREIKNAKEDIEKYPWFFINDYGVDDPIAETAYKQATTARQPRKNCFSHYNIVLAKALQIMKLACLCFVMSCLFGLWSYGLPGEIGEILSVSVETAYFLTGLCIFTVIAVFWFFAND